MEPLLIVISVVATLIFFAVAYTLLTKEKFSPEYTGPETYVKSVDTDTQDPTILSNGTVQKYFENGKYTYNLFFNLPAIGSSFQTSNLDIPFNSPIEIKNYTVKMGTTDFDQELVGELSRQPNGYHTLELTSDKNYNKVCVYIGNTLVNCVKI